MAKTTQTQRNYPPRGTRNMGDFFRFQLGDRALSVLMILPAALLVFVFAIFPMLQGLYASFFQIEAATLEMQFNGLENYHWLVTQSLFWKSLLRSIYWVVGTTVAQLVLGVSISLLIHQELRGRNIARGMVLFPYLMPAVVIALTWRFMLDPTMGVFNRMLMDFGLIQRPIAFLANRRTALLFVIIAGVWKYTPFIVMMCLARLQVIPIELEEAARIDGAGAWQVFRHITLPWLMPVLIVTLLLRTIWTFRQFDIVYLFTFGGPLFGTTTLPVLVRYLAFDAQRIGPAAATATLMLAMLLLMSWGYFTLYARAERELE
jgi:multiple sugar transport system permease protein